MAQFKVPAVLRKKIRVPRFIGIFIDDIIKGVQTLKYRPVDPSPGGHSKAVQRIRLIRHIAAWEEASVVARYRRVILLKLMCRIGSMFISEPSLIRKLTSPPFK